MPTPFLQRLGLAEDDFVSTFEAAAVRNFIDANALRRSTRRAAAIYLFGYSVEMRVKAAYFRFHFQAMGLPPDTRITAALRNSERDSWLQIAAPRKPGPHDIEGWANLLVRKRDSLGASYHAAFATEVINRAADVYLNWREYIRYRSIRVFEEDLRKVQANAVWFRLNYHHL